MFFSFLPLYEARCGFSQCFCQGQSIQTWPNSSELVSQGTVLCSHCGFFWLNWGGIFIYFHPPLYLIIYFKDKSNWGWKRRERCSFFWLTSQMAATAGIGLKQASRNLSRSLRQWVGKNPNTRIIESCLAGTFAGCWVADSEIGCRFHKQYLNPLCHSACSSCLEILSCLFFFLLKVNSCLFGVPFILCPYSHTHSSYIFKTKVKHGAEPAIHLTWSLFGGCLLCRGLEIGTKGWFQHEGQASVAIRFELCWTNLTLAKIISARLEFFDQNGQASKGMCKSVVFWRSRANQERALCRNLHSGSLWWPQSACFTLSIIPGRHTWIGRAYF